ncbi:hypothetical protein [Clostridium brassicae]|uniref:YtxH domain-containing protein n=1 Tax=Clostridium brassicae TaxID=2999072 RepID=A0ABT4D9V8_9CLOT|nr:hypothetical protein [Clostridium brassicae]MCY6957946.1 hypothetical protein [Clostridium brassicae]
MGILKEIVGIVIGAIISMGISHVYYKKSGEELAKYITDLSNEINILKDMNSKLENNVKLQMEREFELDNNRKAKFTKHGDEFNINLNNCNPCSLEVMGENDKDKDKF